MSGAVFLEGEDIELRTIEEEDIEWMRDKINDPEIRNYLQFRYPQNIQQEKEFFENQVSGGEGQSHLIISQDGESKGMISLIGIDAESGNAEIGLWIDPDEQNKGLGTKASRLMIDYGFKELRLHRIHARVFDHNVRSKKIWKNLGFEEEGVLREVDFIDGEFRDLHIYGLLEDEWEVL